jgi:hypothetical protein
MGRDTRRQILRRNKAVWFKRAAPQVATAKPARRRPKRRRGRPRWPSWEQRFKELEQFTKAHGHCKVPRGYPPNGVLGRWVVRLRERRKRGKLDKEQIRCLNAVGFCREGRMIWKERVADLKTFKKEHGHCNVKNLPPDGIAACQRLFRAKTGQLHPGTSPGDWTTARFPIRVFVT